MFSPFGIEQGGKTESRKHENEVWNQEDHDNVLFTFFRFYVVGENETCVRRDCSILLPTVLVVASACVQSFGLPNASAIGVQYVVSCYFSSSTFPMAAMIF